VELQKLKESIRHEDQIQPAYRTIADLENEIEIQNVLLSEQTANRFQDQSAHQKISKSRKEQCAPLGTKGRTREINHILEGACE